MRPEYREEPCRSALNRVEGLPFRWSLNPYMGCAHRCTFCYVRGFELRAERPSGEAYGRSIRVKTNVVEVLRGELQRRSWERETVALGTATDPYQPVEGEYRLTRGCIDELGAARTPISIITRSPMIVRDIDVLANAARRADVQVSFSVPTLDERAWQTTEPGTAPPRQRLRALERLSTEGIKAGVAVAPILPGLTDASEQLEAVLRAARDAGAAYVWCRVLDLRPGKREHFLERLAVDWPELVPVYERLYTRAYLRAQEKAAITERFATVAAAFDIRDRRIRKLEAPPPPRQLALFA
ncbi:MAG: radical SAM protein [Dehalococcoidia bacterium]|nr:radical SAM protein [Dehalococcoidia bacterium]